MKNPDVTSTTENNNNKNDNINVILICPFKRKWRFYKKKSINKSKNWLWIFLKFKFCSGKDCEEDEKTSYKKEENTCRPICDKWLAAELHKEPSKLNRKKKKPQPSVAKKHGHLTKEDIQMAKNHMILNIISHRKNTK